MLFDHRRPLLAYLLCVALCVVVILSSLRGTAAPGPLDRYTAGPGALLPPSGMVEVVAATEFVRELGVESAAELVVPGIAVIQQLAGPAPWAVSPPAERVLAPAAEEPTAPGASQAAGPDVSTPAGDASQSGAGIRPDTTTRGGGDGGGTASAGDSEGSSGPTAAAGGRGPADHARAGNTRDSGPRARVLDRRGQGAHGKLRADRTPGRAQGKAHHRSHGKALARGHGKADRPAVRRHPRR